MWRALSLPFHLPSSVSPIRVPRPTIRISSFGMCHVRFSWADAWPAALRQGEVSAKLLPAFDQGHVAGEDFFVYRLSSRPGAAILG